MGELIRSINDLKDVAKEILVREKNGKSDLNLMGNWIVEHKRGDIWLPSFGGKNIIPTAGLNHILNVIFHTESKISNWYVGIFKNNYTPLVGNTAANSLGSGGYYGECSDSDYTPAGNRVGYVPAAATTATITNAANKAEFTIVASSNITVHGAFLVSVQTKMSTTGLLVAAKKFDTARTVVNGDVLFITYEITAQNV